MGQGGQPPHLANQMNDQIKPFISVTKARDSQGQGQSYNCACFTSEALQFRQVLFAVYSYLSDRSLTDIPSCSQVKSCTVPCQSAGCVFSVYVSVEVLNQQFHIWRHKGCWRCIALPWWHTSAWSRAGSTICWRRQKKWAILLSGVFILFLLHAGSTSPNEEEGRWFQRAVPVSLT